MRCLICGMDINIKNFNINNKGLLEDNKSKCIKYCPFCGVNAKYIVESEELFEAPCECLDPSNLVILDHAMKLEIFNSDFYKSAALLASSIEIKETFEALSTIERMHAIVHMKLGGFKELPKLVSIDYSKHKTDQSLMNLAEDREIHASRFYEKNIKKIVNPNVKQVFIALSEVERDHIKIAKSN
ncbi:ferritin-like domain-containing protein [Clostridium sp.]|uniref:ferritin-like domain-containing protein n=1 Tax=Clostridium sp. TaxID=1506 RepID=UPI003D6D617A